ncbi:MAG: PaaI family thioesterase [Gemmatimonadota bacterium]|nr:PaaI family thioesterase [Gemmatimonadota bacterium]
MSTHPSPDEHDGSNAPPSAAVLRELALRWNDHPGVQRLGVALELGDAGALKAVVDPIQPHHRGGMGTEAVNGPTIAGVFDLVVGLTGYLHALGRRVGVAQLNIQFLEPLHGRRFVVVGRPRRVGKTLIFIAAEALDEAGTTCARCDGLVSVSLTKAATGDLAL